MRSEDLNRVIEAFGPSDLQKQRMLEGITRHSSTQVRQKRSMAKVLIIAVVISLFSGTAVALSNTELFKGIFGNSIYVVEDEILFPMESVADDQFKLTLEGVLSDTYNSIAIVSVEALNEQSRLQLEQVSSNLQIGPLQQNIQSNSTAVVELHHLAEQNKKRFMVEFRSMDGPLNGDLEVSLTTEKSRLTLSAPTVSTIPTMIIQLDEVHYASADYVPQTVIISPLTVVVEGYEKGIGYQIPTPNITLHFADGTTIDVFNQDTVFNGSRFPEEGVTMVSAQFEKIMDLKQLRFITVDGVKYPIGENEMN